MSDYFGALMRSGGMAIAGRAPAVAQARSVEAHVLETEVERTSPAMPPRTVQSASPPPPAVAPIPAARAVERPAPATEAANPGGLEMPAAQADATTPPATHPGGVADAAADPSSAPAASTVAAPKQALGERLVRAAMHWVAADPQPARGVRPPAPPHQPSWLPVTDGTPAITLTQTRRDDEVEREAQPPIAAPTFPAAAADPTAREPVEAHALPIRSVRPSPATPPVSLTPSAPDEVVEISIGAIHVRVDAPAAQTVARHPVTPPPAAPRAAAGLAPRSGLSRRALRRI